MQTLTSLYDRLLKAGATDKLDREHAALRAEGGFDPRHLDALLNPRRHPAVIRLRDCACETGGEPCVGACLYQAIARDADGKLSVSKEHCVGCGECIKACPENNLTEIREAVPVFRLLNDSQTPVYALIAPAYTSQFSGDVTTGKLRSALEELGFAGMIEVALFADILTLKEALEFDRSIQTDDDFMLTSCCCPMWIAMIRKVYATLVPHMPPSVSPMVAGGRAVKTLYPGAKTVFIGPCVAKKAEARNADIADAVDFVLTFDEMRDIFAAAGIDPAAQPDSLPDYSSEAGRIYAATSGVSKAVQRTLDRLMPERKIPLRARHADGAVACKALLKEILDGKIQANFIEGMGCVGGCVGGPKALIDKNTATKNVRRYGEAAAYRTPADNPYVINLLKRLGFDTIESLLEQDTLFIRNF